MSETQRQETRPVHMPPKTEKQLEAEAVKWCEKLSRKLDTKRSKTKRRGQYENSRR